MKVGDPEIDHKCWQRPETMTEKRPSVQINASFPGTEVAAETAAAMASASLVFKRSDLLYSKLLLGHAKQRRLHDVHLLCIHADLPRPWNQRRVREGALGRWRRLDRRVELHDRPATWFRLVVRLFRL